MYTLRIKNQPNWNVAVLLPVDTIKISCYNFNNLDGGEFVLTNLPNLLFLEYE